MGSSSCDKGEIGNVRHHQRCTGARVGDIRSRPVRKRVEGKHGAGYRVGGEENGQNAKEVHHTASLDLSDIHGPKEEHKQFYMLYVAHIQAKILCSSSPH
eukprot:scpid83271/ scgid30788/ 